MIDKSLILIWFIWYVYAYGLPPFIFHFLINFYELYNDFFIYYNKLVYHGYWDNGENINNSNDFTKTEEVIQPLPAKYEDKYINDIRKMSKEWVFTDEEKTEIPHLFQNFLNGAIEFKQNRIDEINSEIQILNNQISEDTDNINYIETSDSDGDEIVHHNTLEERNEERNRQILILKNELAVLKNEIESDEGICELKQNAQNEAEKYIINKRLDKLNNSYVIEKTPIGNVLMIYKRDSESFQYYSDCNIPYRYLEVVGRKYVKFFNCRPIFVDMDEELKLFEEKWEKACEAKKLKEDKKKAEEASINQPKKNVFAKFKNYNKEAGGKISMAAPPKNSIPNRSTRENKEDEKILLKERANRYTYEGKFANFNFLQKIERKVFNKKLGLSFSDFKKTQQK